MSIEKLNNGIINTPDMLKLPNYIVVIVICVQ